MIPVDSMREGIHAGLGLRVTGNYFDALGIHPYLGASSTMPMSMAQQRSFLSDQLRILHGNFQDDRGVVGRVVQVNKHPFTILGVAPPEFSGHWFFFFRTLGADG